MTIVEADTQVYGIAGAEKVLRVNPLMSLEALMNEPACPDALREGLQNAAVWQVRNETSVEKVVSAASLLPEITLALLVLDAHVLLQDGRTVALDKYYQQSGKRVAIEALLIPITSSRFFGAERIGVSPKSDPVIAVAVSADLKNKEVLKARIALFGVWPGRQWLAKCADGMEGKELSGNLISQISGAVVREVEPKGDYRGSAEYRQAMAGVLVERALEMCLKGAK